jgi:hypothetical protein
MLLFVIANLCFAALNLPVSGLSLYNRLLPGYQRFPILRIPGQNPDGSPGFTNNPIYNLNTLFASHVISSGPKPADEFRVILLGDSSVWGALLRDNQTLASQITQAGFTACAGKRVVVYDLGWPYNSATKDLLILSRAINYEPDLIIWLFSLQAFVSERQTIPFVTENADSVRELVQDYNFRFDTSQLPLSSSTYWDRTIIGQSRALNQNLRLHIYELSVQATGTDYPLTVEEAEDTTVKAPARNVVYQGRQPPLKLRKILQLDSLRVSNELASKIPIVFVNEPIYINTGKNSRLRYNWLYPRWAYNQYRRIMQGIATQNSWEYLDYWNLLTPDEFSDSVFHRNLTGEARLAKQLIPVILDKGCRSE